MDRKAIAQEAAAGTALYYSTSNRWADFSEYHGRRVFIMDPVVGHWAYNNETRTYEKKASAITFHRTRTTTGFLVREVAEDGREVRRFIASAAHLRGAWTACQGVVKANQAAQAEIDKKRDESARHTAAVLAAISEEFGIKMRQPPGLLSTEVAVSGVALLALLRSLRDAS